ncbi:MAG: nucleotide exchange factor GrpE [Henriciella sp.]|nr:nucleotide exchange factor GrpE [Henriciella sp.]
MSDEKIKDGMPEIDAGASKADLKNAADDILKAAKAADKAAKAAEEASDEEFGEPVPELEPEVHLTPDQQIQILEAEKEELRDQLLRTLAETDNIRKRAEREKADTKVYAIEKFALDLLSVSDNMARALEALPEAEREALTEGGKGLLGGIEMTQKELHTVLTRHGVTAIEAEPGAAFDPNLHQAVANIPSEHPNGTIASLFQGGWKIGNRTLRAAMVAVSAGQAN